MCHSPVVVLSLSLPLFLSPSLPLFLFKIVRTIWPSLSSGKPLLIFIWVTWLSNYWLHKANIQYSNHRMGRIFAVSVDFCPTPVLYEYLSWDIPLVDDVMWPVWLSCDITWPQVGNCVAKRNYRFFYLFLVTITVMSLYVMGCNVAVVVVGKYPKLWSSTPSYGGEWQPFPSLNIVPPSQSRGAWEGGYFVLNAGEN